MSFDKTTTPAESYPRYSKRFNPLSRIGVMLSLQMPPTIPHMVLIVLSSYV
ncbi:MAG: hypothetical protein Rsou_1987 [Candidatus Ruthia sp. Asou_11_S2]|nr:hypothetical protein [Candidatus Ruthia sp. Asou_11_S2]